MDIFTEINDAVRQENLKQVWTKYHKPLIGGVAAIIIATVAFVVVKHYQTEHRGDMAAIFMDGMSQANEGQAEEAVKSFQTIVDEDGGGYEMLAHFQLAALNKKAGDVDGALAQYQTVADSNKSVAYKHLAVVQKAMLAMEQHRYQAVFDQLGPLLEEEESPYRISIREIYAMAAYELGRPDDAVSALKKTSEDDEAPAAAVARAKQLIAVIKAGRG